MDWERTDRTDLPEMAAAGERMADRFERYFDAFPARFADVGCGPAFAVFALAPDHAETEFRGYDAAESVVRRNRALAADRGLDNPDFDVATLPAFDVDATFDCVACVATLHYVADVESAVASLFDHVAPGGTLVFDSPNRHTRDAYRADPDGDEDRFRLVVDGENLLTYRDVRRVTRRRPRSLWKAVGAEDWRSVGRTNPCVVVEK